MYLRGTRSGSEHFKTHLLHRINNFISEYCGKRTPDNRSPSNHACNHLARLEIAFCQNWSSEWWLRNGFGGIGGGSKVLQMRSLGSEQQSFEYIERLYSQLEVLTEDTKLIHRALKKLRLAQYRSRAYGRGVTNFSLIDAANFAWVSRTLDTYMNITYRE